MSNRDSGINGLTGKQITCPDGSYIVFRDLIGHGATGTVYRCDRLAENVCQTLAAKVVDTRKLQFSADFARERDKLKREVAILASLSHTGVVNLHGVVDSDSMLILLMDLVKKGELFNSVLEMGALSEEQARYVFVQIATTLKFLHSEGVIHRDLKLENILIADEPQPGYFEVKLADFGLSKLISGQFTQARSYVGTPQYWAPEVIQSSLEGSHYSFEADVWSLGCLLYVMIGGTYPFTHEKDILSASYHFRYKRFDDVSTACLNMIRSLLKVKPAERASLEEILNSEWCTKPWKEEVPPLPPLIKTERASILINIGPTIIGAKQAGISAPVNAIVPAAVDSRNPLLATVKGSKAQFKYQLFDSKYLLELLSRVFYRFHQACLLFKEDRKLKTQLTAMLATLKDLIMDTTTAFRRFQVTCGSVLELLQDVYNSVAERHVELVEPMFDNLKHWLQETLAEGRVMRQRFSEYTKSAAELVNYARDFSPVTPLVPQSPPALEYASAEQRLMLADRSQSPHRKESYETQRTKIFEDVSNLVPPVIEEGMNVEDDSRAEIANVTKRLLDSMFIPTALQVATVEEAVAETEQSCCDEATALRPIGGSDCALITTTGGFDGDVERLSRMNGSMKAQVLLCGVKELQQINDILEQCTSFWDNLDVTVGLMRKFRDQTVTMLQITTAANNERFLERLKTYETFWIELSNQCDVFVEGSIKSVHLMRKLVEAFNASMVRGNITVRSVICIHQIRSRVFAPQSETRS